MAVSSGGEYARIYAELQMQRGEYAGLFTDTEVNNNIIIYQSSESVKEKITVCIFMLYFEICKQTWKLTIVSY